METEEATGGLIIQYVELTGGINILKKTTTTKQNKANPSVFYDFHYQVLK